MLNSQGLEEVDRFRNQVRVKFVQIVTEERCEVLGHFFTLLKAGAESVSESSNIRHMVVLGDFSLLIDVLLKLCIFVLVEKPLEDCLLNFLVVFVLEKLIREEPD